MAKKNRYYIKPSYPGSNSYSVYERGRKNQVDERFCTVPMVTLYQAKRCCANLNANLGAWAWEGNDIAFWDSHYSVVELNS